MQSDEPLNIMVFIQKVADISTVMETLTVPSGLWPVLFLLDLSREGPIGQDIQTTDLQQPMPHHPAQCWKHHLGKIGVST